MSTTLPTRKIAGVDVTAISYGAMGISIAYSPTLPDEQRFKFLDDLYATGCTSWDSADIYGDCEELLGRWFAKTGKRSDIFLATKFGFTFQPDRPVNGSPEYVKAACARSLKRFATDYIDLYYLHRPDPTVPIEVTVGAMAELVKEGKVKYLGLSEVTAKSLRRAHAVHPIAAYQVEYSPFCLEIESDETGLLKTCRELGIAVVAYSPLGRGLLTGKIKGPEDFSENDFRATIPKFSKENFPKILKIVDVLKEIGVNHGGAAPSTVCLAWLLAQGDDIIPIPGTTKLLYLKENLAALEIKLTDEEVQQIRAAVKEADLSGDRYGKGHQELLLIETPPL